MPHELDELSNDEINELLAFDLFVEPLGNKPILHMMATQLAMTVNLNRKKNAKAMEPDDFKWWSAKNRIKTGFATDSEILAALNGEIA